MKKKIFLLLTIVVILAFSLLGCTPNVRLSDIYVNHAELTEFDGARLEGVIPSGFTIAYGFNKNNKNESPFFTTHNWVIIANKNSMTQLAVYDYKNRSFVVGEKDKFCYEIKKNENFIIYQETSSSDVMLRDCKSTNVINLKEQGINKISDVKIPSQNSDIFVYNTSNHIKVYDAQGHIFQIKIRVNGSYCPEVAVYDNYIVQSNNTLESSIVVIYAIPESRYPHNENSESNPAKDAIFSSSRVYPSYIGNGKFYVFMQDLENTDNFQFKDGNQGYKGKVKIYNAKTETIEKEYSDSKYYKRIISSQTELLNNEFGDLQVSINDVLNTGYKFAEGISINPTTKAAEFDQFILNSNNEVVMSLTGRHGSDIKLNKDRVQGISPLMLLFIDGKGFSPNTALGGFRIINIDGTTAFEKHDGFYQNLFYNNNALVLKKVVDFKGTVLNQTRYGAFDSNGKQIIEFKYDYMTPFIDDYALATDDYLVEKVDGKDVVTNIKINDIYLDVKDGLYHRPDGTAFAKDFKPQSANKITKAYRIDKLGNAVEIEDMAHTRTNKLVFKVGAYVSKNADGKYNVKNAKGDKIFNENFDEVFSDVVIDRPNLDEVTICGTRNGQVYIYTLTSSTRGIPKARTIHDVIVPSVIVGSLALASIVIIAVIKINSVKAVKVEGDLPKVDNTNAKNKKKK